MRGRSGDLERNSSDAEGKSGESRVAPLFFSYQVYCTRTKRKVRECSKCVLDTKIRQGNCVIVTNFMKEQLCRFFCLPDRQRYG